MYMEGLGQMDLHSTQQVSAVNQYRTEQSKELQMVRMPAAPSPRLILRMPYVLMMSVVHLIAILAVTAIIAALQICTEAKAMPTAAYASQKKLNWQDWQATSQSTDNYSEYVIRGSSPYCH